MSKKYIWVNPNQKKLLRARQKVIGCVAGRGGGKTTNIGDQLNLIFREMPRSKGAMVGKTFGQAYTKTLPEVLDRMSMYGHKEYLGSREPGHYVVTKTPPDWFAKPYKQPRKYDNTVTWVNGMTMDLLSFDRPDLGRGGSYDWMMIDEAALIDYTTFTKTLRPLLRGNIKHWDHWMRFRMMAYTSRSWTKKGKWVEETIKKLAADYPEDYYYAEFSAQDNLPVLGQAYFDRAKKEMDPITYAVEILNQPISKIPNAFYEALDEERHLYSQSYDYDYTDQGTWSVNSERDVNPELDLEVSFDFNAAFTSATIWQEHQAGKNDGMSGLVSDTWELRLLRNFYVKYTQVDHLVANIANHYSRLGRKIVRVYGGRDGHSKWKALTEYTYYEMIKKKFEEMGWQCYIMVDMNYADVEHKLKHLTINAVLRENDSSLPVVRVNEEAAKESFISMSQTPIKGDFQKDKSSERDENLEQQYATHLSDTIDNYVFPKSKSQITQQSPADLLSSWTG